MGQDKRYMIKKLSTGAHRRLNPKDLYFNIFFSDFQRDISRDATKRYILPAKWILQMLLVWPDTDNQYFIAANALLILNIIAVEVFHASYVVVSRKDITKAILTSVTVTTTMEGLVRLYIIVFKKPIINDMLYKIWKQFWPTSSMNSEIMQSLKTRCYVGLYLTFGCFGSGIFCNTIITLRPYYAKEGLILNSIYPFDWNQTVTYELVYIWQYFTQWYLLVIVNIFDNLLILIMILCIAQFIILQNIFKDVFSERSKHHRLLLFGEVVCDKTMIRKCLRQQRMLFGVCEQLRNIFNTTMLLQFFISTMALCSSCVMLKTDPNEFSKMLTYAVAHMFQLFNYCYTSSELSYQCGNMANAIYESNWESTDDIEYKKSLVVMIQRSQKVQPLSAAGIVDVDLESYVKVLRLSFSFYTLINTFLDG